MNTTGHSIPLCEPAISGNEWNYIRDCLDERWVSSVGAYVDRFEKEIASYVNASCGVATCNGTAALHLALLVAGIQPDQEVLVSDLTFIAPANTVRYVGAWPVLIDVEPCYWQMDPAKVETFLDKGCRWNKGMLVNKDTGRQVKAIMPVHILGHPVDMDPILSMAAKYELAVIEDATESLGAYYKKRPVGSLGDVACFSFNGNKIITTGGGGMLVTNRKHWADKARYLSTQAKDDPLEYIHGTIGYNYRLTNIQAALGCAQLEQLAGYIKAKRRIASAYNTAFAELPGIVPMEESREAESIAWMYTVLIDESRYGMNSRNLMGVLREHNIQTRPLWQPLHLSPAHRQAQSPLECPVAERIYRQSLSLPCSVSLTSRQQKTVSEIIRSTCRAC